MQQSIQHGFRSQAANYILNLHSFGDARRKIESTQTRKQTLRWTMHPKHRYVYIFGTLHSVVLTSGYNLIQPGVRVSESIILLPDTVSKDQRKHQFT